MLRFVGRSLMGKLEEMVNEVRYLDDMKIFTANQRLLIQVEQEALDYELQQLTTEVEIAQEDNDALRSELYESKAQIKATSEERDVLEDELAKLEMEVKTVKDERGDLQGEVEELRQEMQTPRKEIYTIEDEKETLETQRDTIGDHRDELKYEMGGLEDTIIEVEEERKTLEAEIETLGAKNRVVESRVIQWKVFTQALEQLKGSIERRKMILEAGLQDVQDEEVLDKETSGRVPERHRKTMAGIWTCQLEKNRKRKAGENLD